MISCKIQILLHIYFSEPCRRTTCDRSRRGKKIQGPKSMSNIPQQQGNTNIKKNQPIGERQANTSGPK